MKLVMSALFILSVGFLYGQDWANLEKYRSANEALSPPSDNEHRVVFMGNSITEGWVNMRPDFFTDNPYIGRGIGGQTTPQMLIRMRPDVIDLDPAVVVILAGTNDIAGNTGPMTLEEILGNMKSMAELAEANNIKVVLSSVLPAHDYPWRPGLSPDIKIPKLNEMISEYCEEKGFVYLDYFSAMADDRNGLPKKYAADEVHPTDLAYSVMEPMVKAAIAEALK